MHDPDTAPQRKIDDILHWMVINIPGTASELPENVPADAKLPDGSIQLKNQAGVVGYRGPGLRPSARIITTRSSCSRSTRNWISAPTPRGRRSSKRWTATSSAKVSWSDASTDRLEPARPDPEALLPTLPRRDRLELGIFSPVRHVHGVRDSRHRLEADVLCSGCRGAYTTTAFNSARRRHRSAPICP